jgi:hypothetical protein
VRVWEGARDFFERRRGVLYVCEYWGGVRRRAAFFSFFFLPLCSLLSPIFRVCWPCQIYCPKILCSLGFVGRDSFVLVIRSSPSFRLFSGFRVSFFLFSYFCPSFSSCQKEFRWPDSSGATRQNDDNPDEYRLLASLVPARKRERCLFAGRDGSRTSPRCRDGRRRKKKTKY